MGRCPFCNIWQMKSEPLPLAQRLSLLKEISEIGIRFVDFTGGEPLLCKELPELLAEARRLGLTTSVTTNCVLYPQRHEELLGLVDFLAFSLHGSTAPAHEAVLGIPCFDRLLESVKLAKSSGELLNLHATATAQNIADLPAMARLAQELQVPLAVFPEFAYCGNTGLDSSLLAQLKQVGKLPGVYLNLASVKIAAAGGNQISKPVCRGINGAIAITPEGGLAIPCFHQMKHALPIVGQLAKVMADPMISEANLKGAGRLPFCQGCQNWCYLNTSLANKASYLAMLQNWSTVRRYKAVANRSGHSVLHGLSFLRKPKPARRAEGNPETLPDNAPSR